MTSTEADHLHRKFIAAAEADEILAGLDRLNERSEIASLPEAEVLGLHYSGLRALHRSLGSDAGATHDIIVQRLLPICVRDAGDDELDQNVVLINCRDLAGEWLNGLVGPMAATTKDAALAFLIARLDATPTCLPSCWTISEIGYRTSELTRRLWQLTDSHDQETSDTALATLAELGLIGDERQRCLTAALTAAHERLPYTIVGTLAALPDPTTIGTLSEAWLDRSQAELEAVAEPLFSLFAQVGATLREPVAIDQACVAIATLLARAPAALGRRLRLAGNAVPHLDSPLAAEMLIRLLPEETSSASYDRWLVMLRLEECCRPRQLDGMEGETSRDPAVISALFRLVSQPGAHLGRDSTFEGQVKIAAVKTALLIGAAEALDWLGPALANEANPYLQHEIMEAYAALRVAPLPEPIPNWIVEEKNVGSESADGVELMRRLAASRVARSAATVEAFELLSRPGLLREGAVMLETAEGLVAATLAVGADPLHRPQVLERLFSSVERPVTPSQLASACRALATAARNGWLLESALVDRLLTALTSEPGIPLQPHDRAQLVAAVEALPPASHPHWLPERLAAWANEEGSLGERSIQILVQTGRFFQFEDSLAPKLGLARLDDGRWEWSVEATAQLEWAPLGVVLLYAHDPKTFSGALCAVLDDKRWFVRHDSVGLLQRLVLAAHATLQETVRDALMARARRRQSTRFADPPLLRQVAVLLPERFAREAWSVLYNDWMEDARVALADALGTLPSSMLLASPDLRRSVAAQLVELARDGQFAVRRSAQRSLGRVHGETLESFCESLSGAADVEQRALAAEAWAWLPLFSVASQDETSSSNPAATFWTPDIERWSKTFAADASKRVRDTARRAAAARERREWADTYFLRLATLANASGTDLLMSWKLGNALAQTGDDETLRRLREHLVSASLAPSVRFRLSRVTKDLEKRWDAVTKKWSQPSLSLPGGLATFEGRLRSHEREWAVHCTLWHIAGITEDSERRWGGIAVAETVGHELEFIAAFGNRDALLLVGRSESRVAVNSVGTDGLMAFRGLGKYPAIAGSDGEIRTMGD